MGNVPQVESKKTLKQKKQGFIEIKIENNQI